MFVLLEHRRTAGFVPVVYGLRYRLCGLSMARCSSNTQLSRFASFAILISAMPVTCKSRGAGARAERAPCRPWGCVSRSSSRGAACRGDSVREDPSLRPLEGSPVGLRERRLSDASAIRPVWLIGQRR